MNIPTLYYVNSSNIEGIAYDEQTLYIMYGNNKVYKYNEVDVTHYNLLINSKSIGKHVSQYIKPKFECELGYTVKTCYVQDYRGKKIIITNIDEERGYILIDGVEHKMFDPSPDEEEIRMNELTKEDLQEFNELIEVLDSGKYNSPHVDMLKKIKQALTVPTKEEVCKTLSEYYDVKVIFERGIFYKNAGGDTYDFIVVNELFNTPKLITMIGRFYENMKASDV